MSLRHKFLSCLLVSFSSLILTGCHQSEEKFQWTPTLGTTEQTGNEVRSIESAPTPHDYDWKQKHRSSHNFSTVNMKSGPKLLWTCDSDDITFDVYIDKTGSDDIFATSLFNNAITEYFGSNKLYIANPSGASQNFTVTYQILTDNPEYVYITSSYKPQDGQSHRSSENFNLGDQDMYRIECPDGVSFDIMEDVTGNDNIIVSGISNGGLIPNPGSSKDLYIANPSGRTAAFMITFIPYESDPEYTYVTSSPSPMDGQDNRASQNFRLGDEMLYQVQCPDGVNFGIWEDVSGKDNVIISEISNGCTIANPGSSKDLYIANPSGSDNAFMITFTPYPSNPDYIYITSAASPLEGQEHRSSPDISSSDYEDCKLWMVECDENISFDWIADVTWDVDRTAFNKLTNGTVLNYIGETMYIANPVGATSAFTVTLKPYTPEDPNSIVITCNYTNGELYRSSFHSFKFGSYVQYQVECDEGISFDIVNADNGSVTNIPSITNLKNGDIITTPRYAGFSNYYIKNPKGATQTFNVTLHPIDNSEWMTQLSDNTYLYDLSIPGTHDSGTSAVGGIAKCQNTTIATQLQAGIRYFDIRVDEGLNIKHSSVDCKIDFSDVMNDFKEYLSLHPGEVILMELSNSSSGEEVAGPLSSYLNDPIMWTGNYIPTLGEARGKVVLLRRFAGSSKGINILDIWPDDTVNPDAVNGDGCKFYIEDRYFSADEAIHDTREKSELVNNAIQDAINNPGNQKMYLIFNSVAGRLVYEPWVYAWATNITDPTMNPELSNIISNLAENGTATRPLRIGIIIMDFYCLNGIDDPCKLVDRIINLNFTTPIRQVN